jgi:hypothetical protein
VNPADLGRYANALLGNLVADLDAAGVPVPARRFQSVGQAPHMCSQLAVWTSGLQPSQGGRTGPLGEFVSGLQGCVATHIATFQWEVVVCATSSANLPNPPTAQLQADADLASAYAWTMYRTITRRWLDGTVFDPLVGPIAGVPPSVQSPYMDGAYIVVPGRFSFNVGDIR